MSYTQSFEYCEERPSVEVIVTTSSIFNQINRKGADIVQGKNGLGWEIHNNPSSDLSTQFKLVNATISTIHPWVSTWIYDIPTESANKEDAYVFLSGIQSRNLDTVELERKLKEELEWKQGDVVIDEPIVTLVYKKDLIIIVIDGPVLKTVTSPYFIKLVASNVIATRGIDYMGRLSYGSFTVEYFKDV